MNDVSLSDFELRVLVFGHRRWLHAGSGEEAITVEFDLSPTRHHQLPAWSVGAPSE